MTITDQSGPSAGGISADTIDVAQLRQLLARDPQLRLLDVRTGGEFETVHIPGSYNVPLDTLGEHVADLAAVEHPVVLICQSGGRATRAHGSLAGAGKQQVHILTGGITAWMAADGDVVRDGSNRWAMDRQVRLTAGSLVVVGVALSILFAPLRWLSAAVGAGLVVSAVTDTCAMARVLSLLPYNRTDRCDIAGVLEAMQAEDPDTQRGDRLLTD